MFKWLVLACRGRITSYHVVSACRVRDGVGLVLFSTARSAAAAAAAAASVADDVEDA